MKTSHFFLILFFFIFPCSCFSQEGQQVKCTLTIEQIQRQQSFDVDDPKSEDIRTICQVLFRELKWIYENKNEAKSDEIEKHVYVINKTVEYAKGIGMNYSMFSDDLYYVEHFQEK